MKLNLVQIQILDFLIKKLNTNYSFVEDDKNLNIVININNSLWQGDFVIYKNYHIYENYIDFDKCIEYKRLSQSDFVTFTNQLDISKYSNIKLNNIYLLLNELLDVVKDFSLPKLQLTPIMYNAINLNTNTKLPFILLDYDTEYEVLSLSTSTKDECTHS